MNPSVELRAGIYAHWLKYKARGEPMPCAVVVGCPPLISYASVQKMPETLDEIWVAGALAGTPINVVRAKTVDLLVPAEAEIVIEGFIDTEYPRAGSAVRRVARLRQSCRNTMRS